MKIQSPNKNATKKKYLLPTVVGIFSLIISGVVAIIFVKSKGSSGGKNSFFSFPFVSFIPVWLAARKKKEMKQKRRKILIILISIFVVLIASSFLLIISGKIAYTSILPIIILTIIVSGLVFYLFFQRNL